MTASLSETESQKVAVATADGEMPAHLWLPASGTGPGLVMLQEIFGVSDYIKSRSADLAALGYVVLAPELYWRLGSPTVDESATDVLQQAIQLAGQLDWDTTVSDAVAATSVLRERHDVVGGVGVIGFCFGGGLAFNTAAVTEVDVLVSYYGSALGGLVDLAGQVTAPSLHHFGRADPYIDQLTQNRIEAAVMARPGNRFEAYEGAGHAFDNPNPAFHHAEASDAAWRVTTEFLAENLPCGANATALSKTNL
jgi:carboxymethylenebutenolidase